MEPGLTWAPANIKFPFSDEISKIQYRHNNRMIGGMGMAINWFCFKLNSVMISNMRPIKKYGEVNYFDLTLQMSLRKMYFNIDLRNYYGYVIKNAFLWDDELSFEQPNDLSQNIRVNNVNFKTWQFSNSDFHMHPFSGSRGIYNKEVFTTFWASKVEFFRIKNKTGSLIPEPLRDPNKSITDASSIIAFELGALPGLGYVNKYKKWQYGTMIAAGPRIQMKAYTTDHMKSLVSLIVRYDVKVIFGYSVEKFYAMIYFDIDNKSIRFSNYKYNQQFYSLKLQVGIREFHK